MNQVCTQLKWRIIMLHNVVLSIFLPLLSVLPRHRPSAVLPPATVGMIRRLTPRRSEPWTMREYTVM